MIAGPPAWLSKFMQLTYMSWDFKLAILGFGVLYLALAWTGEHWAFQPMANLLGRVKESVFKRAKKRKEYKLIQEQTLF